MIHIFCTSFYHIVDKEAIRYSIANSAPALFKSIPTISLFVPAFSIVADYKNKRITWEQYTDIYLNGLRSRYAELVVLLKTLSEKQTTNMEFCCWENIQFEHCHRAIVADIINKTVAFERIDNIKASIRDLNGIS
jgi:hypothetical protein